MVSVVASTANPISLVPSKAAVTWSLPSSVCLTMFSRTTIASSINRPILSDRASSVIMLMLNPNAQMNVNVPSRVIGKVKPVMTVERKEPKKSKTIKTAKTAPSIMVRTTSLIEARIPLELSATTFIIQTRRHLSF